MRRGEGIQECEGEKGGVLYKQEVGSEGGRKREGEDTSAAA